MLKKNIFIMYAIAFLQGLVFYSSIATLYRQASGVSVFQITIIESISLVLCLIFELPWGVLADKIGYKKTMMICCTLYFVSKIIFWQASSFMGFLAERILLSVVLSGMSGVDSSILYLSCDSQDAQRVFGVYNSLGTAGLLLASLIFTIFIGADYRFSAFLTVLTYGTAAILTLFITEVKKPKASMEANAQKQFFGILRNIFKNKYLLMFLVGAALLNETHQTFTVFLSQLQYVKGGMTDKMIGAAYILITIAGLISAKSSKITEAIGARRLVNLCYALAVLSCVLLCVTSSAVASVISILALRIAFSLFQPMQSNIQNMQVVSSDRATELSVFSVIMNSVGVSTNLIFGAVADVNLSSAFLFGAVFCLLGFILVSCWAKGTKHRFLA
ncbi:MAG: MFS transporter [Ruminococcaceae bacterium]|nr:MFS transporter [Oscillospiraceae bacterium]